MDEFEENEGLDKQFYKIGDVSDILGVQPSTIRYWESEFPQLAPKRSLSKQRYYTPEDVRILRMIHYLVKVKGLRLEAAKEEMRTNRNNISNRLKMIEVLTETRDELKEILAGLSKRK